MISTDIKNFLEKKLREENLSRNNFVELSGISYPVVHELLNAGKPHPSFHTVVKIANAFNSPISDILINSKVTNSKTLYSIQESDVMSNLRTFITYKISTEYINPAKLAKTNNLSSGSISDFISDPPKKKSLGTAIILKLANYWDVSIDEMIGRAVPTKDISLSKNNNKSVAGITNQKDKDSLDKIKDKLAENSKKIISSKSTTPSFKKTQSKSFVERIKQERSNKDTTLKR